MFQPTKFRAAFGYDTEAASDETAYLESMPSKTVQSQAEDVDLNVIMKRFGVTGKMPESFVAPQFGDFTQVFDFRSAQDAIINARYQFDSLPADIRARFANDPQRLLEFVSNDGNMEEARKLGLLKEKIDVAGSGSVDSASGAHAKASAGSGGADGAAAGGGAPAGGAAGA